MLDNIVMRLEHATVDELEDAKDELDHKYRERLIDLEVYEDTMLHIESMIVEREYYIDGGLDIHKLI